MAGYFTNGMPEYVEMISANDGNYIRIPADNSNPETNLSSVAYITPAHIASGVTVILVPLTGFETGVLDLGSCNRLIINPAGTLANGDITLPLASINSAGVSDLPEGFMFEVVSMQIISAVTWDYPVSVAVVGSLPTALAVSIPIRFVYRSSVWYRIR